MLPAHRLIDLAFALGLGLVGILMAGAAVLAAGTRRERALLLLLAALCLVAAFSIP